MGDPLAGALLPVDTDDTLIPRTATVSNLSPLQVDMAGGTSLDATRLTSYTPSNGDVVLVAQTKSQLVILGKLA